MCTWFTRFGVCSLLLVAASLASAQFKVVGPPPFSPTVAREKVRNWLEKVDASNRKETIAALSGLLAWYRDIVDEELIAAWRKDGRVNLTEVMEALADSRVATEVVDFSWREQRRDVFNLADASMLGHLMFRFPESAQPFLEDLLAHPTPNLTEPEAQAVARILIDMPELGTWRNDALRILPHYRQAAEGLLAQDARGSDQEKRYQALRWASDLKWEVAGIENEAPSPRRRAVRPQSRAGDEVSDRERTVVALNPPAELDGGETTPRAAMPAPARVEPTAPARAIDPAAPAKQSYDGPRSGTLESAGGPIPENAEYVFRNLPGVKIQLEYDTKIWEARLVPGEGQTQRLILKNKSSGPQKRCVVHWSVIP